MNNELLVKSIRELCLKKGVAISQLENDLNFGAGLISRWTKSSPSLDKIIDIADYFNISLDEVVGHQNAVNDKFLEKLISQTANNDIEWHKYDNTNKKQPKIYSDYNDFESDFFSNQDEAHKEKSYFAEINASYVSIYGAYEHQDILTPLSLKLFIQPGDNADLVKQSYGDNQLKFLWLKILYSLGEKTPDEIKAEEFKCSFINDFQKPKSPIPTRPIGRSERAIRASQQASSRNLQRTTQVMHQKQNNTPSRPLIRNPQEQIIISEKTAAAIVERRKLLSMNNNTKRAGD